MCPNDTTYQYKCHRGHEHHTAVLIESAVGYVPAVGDNLIAEQFARTEQFAHESHYHQDPSIAEAVAYLDSATTTLKGSLKNKKTYLQQPQIVYKERISYRDSVRFVKEPYPVEKIKKVAPVWAWYTLVFSLLVICYIAFRIYLLIYRPKT